MSQGVLTELQYRTFDSLLEDVRIDLRGYALSGRIEPQQLISVAQRVSYDLGLRINQTKEAVIQVDHSKARLPDDFYVMNFALICGEFSITQTLPQGTTIQDVGPTYTTIPDTQSSTIGCCPTDPLLCSPTRTVNTNTPMCLTKCGSTYQLVQTINTETRTYKYMLPIRFRSSREVFCDCPNLNWICRDEAYIKDGFIFTGVFSTKIGSSCAGDSCPSTDNGCSENCGLYINYEGTLEDSQGNLLVPDHPYLNEYYEYAIKSKILESIFMDGDTTASQQLQLADQRLKESRNNALTVVNTPDFKEMRDTHDLNRKAMYSRFYQPFYS